MIKKIFLFKSLIAFCFINITFTLCSFQSSKTTDEIVLRDEAFAFTPKEFFIADVIDERGGKDAVISGNGVKGFIRRNLEQNKAFRPVNIHIKQLKLTETLSASGKVDGRIDLSLQFYLDKGNDLEILLTSYKSTATYNRNNGHIQDAEPALRQMLENGLAGFNNWMNREADKNILLAKKVKVLFTDYKESPEGDSIYYAANRPLSWTDFKGNIPSSRFDAEVYATIGYNENVEIVKGVVKVNLAVKVCLPKSASWVKPGRETPYALNHEQRHFDIAKIAGEKFKQKVNAELLPVDNYDGPINVVYLDAYREMTDMEKLYDEQTSHGANVTEQEHWNKKIDEELKKLGVK